MSFEYIRLSKTIAHALRHKPESYGLVLDQNGWVPLDALVAAIAHKRQEWRDLTTEEIRAMAAAAEKQRYEITGDHIRVLYGHSLSTRIVRESATPPPQLFHGTAPAAIPAIRREGLQPMRRQYVHLSPDTETASKVARRRTSTPIIIIVHANAAQEEGIQFYRASAQIWLSEHVPPEFLGLPNG
jgi:putative RNA 2'-phosphotransferase